jgi:hypothetical protein
VVIQTPIKQHVFGTRGAYRAVLVEQKTVNVDDFQSLADKQGPPVK